MNNKELSYVYIILFHRFNVIKIGFSENPQNRIKVLTMKSYIDKINLPIISDTYEYKILKVIESSDGRKNEKILHSFFKDSLTTHKTEYFYLKEKDIQIFDYTLLYGVEGFFSQDNIHLIYPKVKCKQKIYEIIVTQREKILRKINIQNLMKLTKSTSYFNKHINEYEINSKDPLYLL